MFVRKDELEKEIKRMNEIINSTKKTVRARAYRSGTNQATTNNQWVTVILNAISFDPLGAFNLSTGEFKAPKSGYYLLVGQVTFSSIQAGIYSIGLYHVNDGRFLAQAEDYYQTVSNRISMPVSDIAFLKTDEKVVLKAYQNSGSSSPVILAGTSEPYLVCKTYLACHLIS